MQYECSHTFTNYKTTYTYIHTNIYMADDEACTTGCSRNNLTHFCRDRRDRKQRCLQTTVAREG